MHSMTKDTAFSTQLKSARGVDARLGRISHTAREGTRQGDC